MALKVKQILNNIIDESSIKYDKNYSRVAKLHKYWSRKPWYVIDQYINKYSKPDQLVLDPFCGSGIIGLQAVMGNRHFIGYDLNPIAVFIAKNSLQINYDMELFHKEFCSIQDRVKEEIMKIYKVKNNYILYTILGKKNGKAYNAVVSNKEFQGKEKILLTEIFLNPSVVFPDNFKFPDKDFPSKFYKDRFSYKGVKRVSDMFTKRNLLALSLLYNTIIELKLKNKDLFMLAFTNTLLHVSKLKAENVRPLGVNNFWIPDDFIEENVWWRFIDRVKNIKLAKDAIANKAENNKINKIPESKIYNKSSLKMSEIKSRSIDYLITDPPYGESIQYSELSFIWNCWLEKEVDIKEEVIINPVQGKGIKEYYVQLALFLNEAKRVLKKDAYFTLAFQNKDLKIWITISKLIRDQGMELIDIASYNTFGSPYNKNWAKFSPKSDFYVTFKNICKPSKRAKLKAVYPSDIVEEIYKYLETDDKYFLSPNKAYDLFVGIVINKIFEGFEITNHGKLNIENIMSLFQGEIKQNYSQSSLFQSGNTGAYGNI